MTLQGSSIKNFDVVDCGTGDKFGETGTNGFNLG
jgi:hypothetical protein